MPQSVDDDLERQDWPFHPSAHVRHHSLRTNISCLRSRDRSASEADPRPSFRLDLREIVLPLGLVVELSIHGRDEARARELPVL